MTHHYDRTGERIEDDEPEPIKRTPAEWCELLRRIAREARYRNESDS